MKTEVEDEDLRQMLISTFRYSLGRSTYMSTVAPELVRKHVRVLTEGDLRQMADDIKQAHRNQRLGMEMDAKSWLKFRDWLLTNPLKE